MRVKLIRYHDVGNVNTRLAQSLNKRQGVLPPLGIAYIASALEAAGHIVDLIDAIALALHTGSPIYAAEEVMKRPAWTFRRGRLGSWAKGSTR